MLLKLDVPDLPSIEIKRAHEDDAEFLCKWWNDGSLMKDVGYNYGLDVTCEDVIKTISSTNLFIVLLDGERIGEVNYKVRGPYEFGIKLIPEYQSKGLGEHILRLFFDYLYYIGAKDIVADVLVENIRGQVLYSKLGFEVVEEKKGGWVDAQGDSRDYLIMVKKYGK